MQVLLVTPSYFPIVGGSEVLTHVIAEKLNKTGIHCDIMTLNMNRKWNPLWREKIAIDGSAVVFREPAINIFPRLPNPFFNILRIVVIPNLIFLRKLRNYDIIHFVGEADLGFPLFSFFVKKPKLLQCVAIFRKGGIYKYFTSKHPSFGKIFNGILPKLADKFVISSIEEKNLLSDLGIPKSKIAILPIGVDTDLFKPNSTKKTENTLLFVGRIYPIKGLHILIRALFYIKTPIHLVVVGSSWDPNYMKKIEGMAIVINRENFHRVTFLGEIDQKALVSIYQRATLVVCPFLYETYSNVVRESLACGTPVVTTGTHLVENHSDGISLALRNPKDLGNVINRLLDKPEMLEEAGREGRKTIERYFSWESVVKALLSIYGEVAALHSNASSSQN